MNPTASAYQTGESRKGINMSLNDEERVTALIDYGNGLLETTKVPEVDISDLFKRMKRTGDAIEEILGIQEKE